MDGEWSDEIKPVPGASFVAYFRLVAIHPFRDGNGWTAGLPMNLILRCGGYPPVDPTESSQVARNKRSGNSST